MRKFYLVLLSLFIITQGIGQEATQSDSLLTVEPTDLLMLSLTYTSNNIKTKNYEYDRIPALMVDINYFNKYGFTGALNFTQYYKAIVNTYEAEAQIGYQKELFSNFTLSTHYAYRKFVGDTTYEGLAQKNTLALNFAYTWKIIDLQISNSYLNGKSDNYFLDLDLGLAIDFDHILAKNDFLLFNPTISATFGTDYWVFQNLGPGRQRIVINYLQRNNFESQRFEYQSLNFFVPIAYSLGNIGFIVNWFYSMPSAKLAKLSWEDQSGVLFSVFYTPKL